jgi:sensor c-di-GMP phosphodiesterase-like protein
MGLSDAVARVRHVLPAGSPLSYGAWRHRQRWMTIILLAHVVVMLAVQVAVGHDAGHIALEMTPLLVAVAYEAAMAANLNQQLLLEEQIRSALVRDQFEVYYQRTIELATDSVMGVEALLRWNHAHDCRGRRDGGGSGRHW